MSPEPQHEHYVDVNTVAAHLCLTKRQVLTLVRAGKLPNHPITFLGKRTKTYRFLLSDIDAYMAEIRLGVKPHTRENSGHLGSPKKAKGENSNG